jgi:hypothetical protein
MAKKQRSKGEKNIEVIDKNIRKENKEEKLASKAVSNQDRSKKMELSNTGNETGHEVLGKTYETWFLTAKIFRLTVHKIHNNTLIPFKEKWP